MEENNQIDSMKEQLICLFCEYVIPQNVLPGAFPKEAEQPVKHILDQAVAEIERKIRNIILAIDDMSSAALRVRLPDEHYIRVMLRAEYMYYASLSGRKAVLRYARSKNENDGHIMRKFMKSYGLKDCSDLKKHEGRIRNYFSSHGVDENAAHDSLSFMYHCLNDNIREE